MSDDLATVSSLPAWVENLAEANEFDDRMKLIYRELLNGVHDWLAARNLSTNPFAWMGAETAVYHYVLMKFRSSQPGGAALVWVDYDRVSRIRHNAVEQLMKMANEVSGAQQSALAKELWLTATRTFFHIVDSFPIADNQKILARQSWALMLEEHASEGN